MPCLGLAAPVPPHCHPPDRSTNLNASCRRWASLLAQELRAQSKLGLPLALGLVASYLIISISLSFVGQLGTAELAAAALGNTLYGMGARLFLMGL